MRSLQQIIDKIKQECVYVSLGQYDITDIANEHRIIQDLNLDSLDYATIMLSCEYWLGIHIDEDQIDWSNIQTIAQLAGLLYQCQA